MRQIDVVEFPVEWNGEPAIECHMIEVSDGASGPRDVGDRASNIMDVGLLQKIIDMLPGTISIKDFRRRYLFVNRGWELSAGLTSDQVLGRTWEELAPPEVGAESRTSYANDIGLRDAAVLSRGRPVIDHEESYLAPGGERMTRLSSKSPLLDPGGAIWGVLSVTFDISKLKRTERELADANQEAKVAFDRLRSTIEVIDAGFLMMDEDFSFLIWNSRYEDLMRLSHREIEASPRLRDIGIKVFGRDPAAHAKLDRARFAAADIASCPVLGRLLDLQAARPDGVPPSPEEIEAVVDWAMLRWGPVPRPDGAHWTKPWETRRDDLGPHGAIEIRVSRVPGIGWVALYTDVSDHRRMEAELRQAKEDAEIALDRLRATQASLIEAEKLASLGGLVAGMAHEINTPIGVALTAVSHLEEHAARLGRSASEDDSRDADFRGLVEDTVDTTRLTLSNLRRAAELISSFKQIAVGQTGDQPFRFHLRAYIEDLVASLRSSLEPGGHRVEIDCPDGLVVDSHPGPLAQVLSNLVMNSTVHAYDPGVPGTLSIHVVETGEERDWVRVTYRDDGRGILPEHLGKIFDPFFTTRRGRGSTGLGLNMVYNLVKHRLRGSISVDSVPGEGVTFVITMPKSVADAG